MTATMPALTADAYYVTIRRGRAVCFAAGPFTSRADADAWVDPVREAAHAVDPWTGFDAFGTSRVTPRDGRLRSGRLNHRLGLAADPRLTTAPTTTGGPFP